MSVEPVQAEKQNTEDVILLHDYQLWLKPARLHPTVSLSSNKHVFDKDLNQCSQVTNVILSVEPLWLCVWMEPHSSSGQLFPVWESQDESEVQR